MGLFQRVKANLRIEEALKYGRDCFGLNLRATLSAEARGHIRKRIEREEGGLTKEAAFFTLAVAVIPVVDVDTRTSLLREIRYYHEVGDIPDDVFQHFIAAHDDIDLDGKRSAHGWIVDALRGSE